MKGTLTPEQKEEILRSLDSAIEKGPWEESNFLHVIGKNLQKIRDSYATYTKVDSAAKESQEAMLARKIALRSGQQEVFVGLYSSEGSNLQSWERILANLQNQVISRPIYANELDVQTFIKSKENKINEAYLSIFIQKDAILPLPPDKIPQDRLGKPVLTLKNKALQVENIQYFCHLFEKYHYVKGRLQKA
jgi:intracellular multiplication protein IcmQ